MYTPVYVGSHAHSSKKPELESMLIIGYVKENEKIII